MTYAIPSSTLLDNVYAALSHAKRRGIVLTLSFHPATVSQLAAEYDLSLPAIHKHLRTLEEAGLIRRKKVGRTSFVAISRASLQEAKGWISQFHTEWGSDSESLENYISNFSSNQ